MSGGLASPPQEKAAAAAALEDATESADEEGEEMAPRSAEGFGSDTDDDELDFLDAQIAQQEDFEIAQLEERMQHLDDELGWHEEATAHLTSMRDELHARYSLLVSDQLSLPPDTPQASLSPSREPSFGPTLAPGSAPKV